MSKKESNNNAIPKEATFQEPQNEIDKLIDQKLEELSKLRKASIYPKYSR